MLDHPSNLAVPIEMDPELLRSYADHPLEEEKQPPAASGLKRPGPAVTIADQIGSGARELAERLAAVLHAAEPKDSPSWAIFDRQLVEKALEEHHLPPHLAKLIPEDRRSYLNDVLDELIGLRPPSWELIPKIAQTVQHLAYVGHVILIGRGASFITGLMPNVFHVRLIESLPRRIERVQHQQNLSPKAAAKFIAKTERERGRYLKAYFHTRLDDDLQYHLVLNTDRIPLTDAVKLIADGARMCFESSSPK